MKYAKIPVGNMWKWLAIDEDGEVALFTHKPSKNFGYWVKSKGSMMILCIVEEPTDYTKTLVKLT